MKHLRKVSISAARVVPELGLEQNLANMLEFVRARTGDKGKMEDNGEEI